MRRQLSAATCGSPSWYATSKQTATGSLHAIPAANEDTSANCRQDISHHAAITPHDGIRTTAVHSAFPAIFTTAENNGYLAAISTVKSLAELQKLCNERTAEEGRRWRRWWNLHPGLRKWRYTMPPRNVSTGLQLEDDEIETLKHERLSAYRELVLTDAERKRNRERRHKINQRLFELTGNYVYKFGK
jgi:hypothetical protein